ncbi:myb-like protein AA [Calliphora vicina]|uniref:myb-like protein AA n=1 Tax=Calliphora vicina TaxID=7373 RepID=UPI00325B28AC
MTVKLAKLFGSSTSNNSSSQVPPPLPPPNPSPVYNYYNHPQLQQKLQKPYNPYMDDDDDDNMSLYSTTASIMTSRDHPFNNSQRPLLADRKPQLLLTQNNNNNNKKKNSTANQQNSQTSYQQQQLLKQQQHHHQLQQQQQLQLQQEKSYISPYVQQQKRDSAKGLHGFNDFDILSQQYNQHLQSPHIGYPYGSPPSPTRTSSTHTIPATAAASSSSTSALQNIANNTTTDFVFDSLATTYGNNNKQQQQQPFASISTALTSTPRYGNINNYGSTTSANAANNASSSSSFSIANSNSRPCYDVNDADYYTARPSTDAMLGKSSRFEDDFCSRRNIDFSKNTHLDGVSEHHEQQQQQQQQQPPQLQSGPFIFGIPPEQQTDFTRMPHGGRSFGDISEDSGITKDDDKYSAKRMQQSTSDTSSTSRDDSTTTTNTSNDGTSRSSRKGAAMFLLRKRNTKNSSTNESKSLKSQDKACVKCVVVGDCAVGKTNLILSYLENRFNTEHVPTASDIYNADVMVNDSPVHLTLCDTAGQDTLDPLRELCYPDSDVFLLCFSVAKPETFHAIKTKWAPRFSKTRASLILVGTQADLRTNSNVLNKLQSNGEQPISYADAWDLATTIGAKYIETSSATQDKVKDVFDTAIWEGLAPTTLPDTPTPFWKKLFCLA